MLYFESELQWIPRSLYDYLTSRPRTAFILSSRCEAILTDYLEYLDSCRNNERYLDVVAFRKYLAREQ